MSLLKVFIVRLVIIDEMLVFIIGYACIYFGVAIIDKISIASKN